jgi:hypothetical protein
LEFCRTTLILIVLGIFLSILFLIDFKKKKREKFIKFYQFPKNLNTILLQTYPTLTIEQIEVVLKGLKEYFYICNIAGKTKITMPSQVVNIAWYNFTLFTKEYKLFCKKSFGRFLYHTPAEAMESKIKAQESIKKIWLISCKRENIVPAYPDKLPILFKLDVLLEINDGFKYTIDCNEENKEYYCTEYIGGNPADSSLSSGGYGEDFGGGCDGGS